MDKNKYIVIDIKSSQGNAFYILAIFEDYLKKSKVPNKKINELIKDALSGDYDHLLKVINDNSNITFIK